MVSSRREKIVVNRVVNKQNQVESSRLFKSGLKINEFFKFDVCIFTNRARDIPS